MLIDVCVLLAQKICGVSICAFGAATDACALATVPSGGEIPIPLSKSNPEIEKQAKRVRIDLTVIMRFMIVPLLTSALFVILKFLCRA